MSNFTLNSSLNFFSHYLARNVLILNLYIKFKKKLFVITNNLNPKKSNYFVVFSLKMPISVKNRKQFILKSKYIKKSWHIILA